MSETTLADVLRRTEKVEIDIAVLDSKSNRLHQDVKDVDKKVAEIATKQDAKLAEIDNKQDQIIAEVTKIKTYGVAATVIIGGLYTLLQIIKSIQIL